MQACLAPLRVALSVLFLVLTSLQPGLASTVGANGVRSGTEFGSEPVGVEAEVQRAHAHLHHSDLEDDAEKQPLPHQHGKSRADKPCKVDCAAVMDVPVKCRELQRLDTRCFEPRLGPALVDGEYAELIRPPNSLN